MAIYYTKSTNIEELTGLLWDRIRDEKFQNPLHSPKVIVPNKNMRKWLNLHLAKTYGMVSHIDFSFLEKTLEEYFTRRAGLPWNQGKSIYPTQDEMQKLILEYLITHSGEPEFSALEKFIQRPSKLFGLSQKLALLFRDYEVNRREWLQVWWEEKNAGSSRKGNSAPRDAKTQKLFSDPLHDPAGTFSDNGYYVIEKKIYSDLFLPDKKTPTPRTLTQWLYRETGLIDFGMGDLQSNNKSKSIPTVTMPLRKPSLHLFCLSQLGYGYLEILESLVQNDNLDIYFYQFHSGNSLKDDSIFSKWQKPQTIIENFCKPKVQNPWPRAKFDEPIRAKSQTASGPKSSGLTVLKSIIDSQPIQTDSSFGKEKMDWASSDATVRFWNAPSTYREVEAVFQDILHKMRVDKNLTYEDFAVLVTDMSAYKPAIEWAFDGGSLVEIADESNPTQTEIRRLTIPYSLTDINAGDSSYLYAAIQEIWKICKRDRLDLQSFKRLLSNPHIFAHLPTETKEEMIACLDHLKVKYEESGREEDSFLISKGIQRIRLGAFFTEEKAIELFDTPGLENTTEDLAITLTTIWEELVILRDTLVQQLTREVWTKDSLNQVSLGLENFFRLQEDDNEFYLFRKWKENLLYWEDFRIDTKSNPDKKSKGRSETSLHNNIRDTFEFLSYITSNSFQAIPFQVGDYLTQGVNVSLLQPMRPIPFRHIYILGLGEGKFPGRTDRSELNLRAQSKIDYRDTTRRQVQEALFWETLHSAQDSLTLSYVGKDLKTDKTFEPCSTLANLMNELKIAKALEIPLHGYSKYYENNSNGMNIPTVSVSNASFEDMGLVSYDYSRVWKNNDQKTRDKLLSKFSNPRELEKVRESKYHISNSKNKYFLREIIRHFRDPLSDYMNRKLQVFKDFEEVNLDENDHEIFQLDSITKAIFIREFYPILAEDLTQGPANFQDTTSWQESWTEDRIRQTLAEIFSSHKKSASFPQRVYSDVQIAEYVNAIQHILVLWGTHLWGKNFTFIPHLVLGNTGLRKPGTKHIVDASGTPAKLMVTVGERNIQILHEWENCFQIADNHYLWIYPKSLKNEIKYDSYNGYHSPFWDDHSLIFFSLLVFRILGIHLTIMNHKSLPDDSTKYIFFGKTMDPTIPIENSIQLSQNDAKEYLQNVIQSLEKEEMPYFSPMNFLRFVTSKEINKNRNSEIIWNASDREFQDYMLADKETALSELPEPVSLYSDVESILEKMSLAFAKEYYKPVLQIYLDGSQSSLSKSGISRDNPKEPEDTDKKTTTTKPKKTSAKKKAEKK